MKLIRTFVESGEKRVFAGAVDWPGWCRSARDEAAALQGLLDYGPRYARVVGRSNIEFQAPTNRSDLKVIEWHAGNGTTDFGAPAVTLDVDKEPLDQAELERLQTVLLACWQAFDAAALGATGKELRKGPRGGGRELEAISEHVTGAEQAYLAQIGWKLKLEAGEGPAEEPAWTRRAIVKALDAAARGDLPTVGPRGGSMWSVHYFIRRTAWHVLDHAWEIEDRSVAA
jgi:hypothetical protein